MDDHIDQAVLYCIDNDGNLLWTNVYASEPHFTAYSLVQVTYGNGVFVAVSNDGGVSTSLDGTAWSEGVITFKYPTDIMYCNGFFLIFGDDGKIAYSPDGITWVQKTAASFDATDITYSNVIIKYTI